MKKKFEIKGMHCNSCSRIIEERLRDVVKNVTASYSKGEACVEFDEKKISEEDIRKIIEIEGYEVVTEKKSNQSLSDKFGFYFLIGIILGIVYYAYTKIDFSIVAIPEIGQQGNLVLLFFVGLLTGFHCISMCGGFVCSYTAKNAIRGYSGFGQHVVYGGSKVISYTIIGAIFGLVGGVFAFSTVLRGWIAIFAGIFMIFYALSMFGFGFFRRFQFNPKILTRIIISSNKSERGYYTTPMVTGLLNGLFIACGPLQAMYLYAAGTGSAISGGLALMAFGLGTLPIMLGFGSLATVINHKTTKKILKLSAIIVLILGVIMLNRGLALAGSGFGFISLKEKIMGVNDLLTPSVVINSDGKQVINMDVVSSGYSPNSFVLKKGVPVVWNINVKELTGCNREIVVNNYGLDIKLKNGLNVVEFIPDKEGTIRWSCWMGMLRGSFVVTEDGKTNQAQIAVEPIETRGGPDGTCGGSCGSSCGGGCGG